ncbi:restriction endonuclease subunit S [Klebsiella sp. C80]|uniref:restriction endonuclease subunit S n=1 Tax=Enterobacteriaceae TaxID=543 RepID=UPI0007C55F17|nr:MULTISPECIES: restriction endonuclease subunit S [Enterobacteriaceae]EFL6597744.1 restriction endonuclease subunit S [Escherichia coli]HBY7276929.1 restriction endonuclease subunit S [Klebsiella pneumoniae]
MSRWRNFCITELADFCNAQRIPLSAMERAHKKGNFPYYGASGIVDYIDNYIFDGSYILISEDGENLKSRKTPIAFEATGKFWVNNHAHVLKAKKPHLTALIIQYFSQLDLSPYLTGAAQPKLNKASLNLIPLYLPIDESEQKAIASILSSLKDKIDLLHCQNKTLESMAETLFRQWFDVDSNDEWQEKNVLDIFTLVGGGTPKTSVAEYWTDEIPWISGGDISAAHQGYLYSTEKSISLAGLQNSSAKLLPKNSTVISARGTVGKYALLARDMAFSQSNYGIVSKIGNYPFFIYLLVGFIVDDLLTAAYGSVFDTITTRTFESVNLKFPSLNSIEKFNEEISPIFSKKETNTQQIKTLETLRDTLLPKLMSGEVRVQYAEEKLESVA